jgi:hypothetical protein
MWWANDALKKSVAWPEALNWVTVRWVHHLTATHYRCITQAVTDNVWQLLLQHVLTIGSLNQGEYTELKWEITYRFVHSLVSWHQQRPVKTYWSWRFRPFVKCVLNTFLGVLSELQKATVSFVMSVPLCFSVEWLGSHWKGFHEICYLRIAWISMWENSCFIKMWQEWRVLYEKTDVDLRYLAELFLERATFQTAVVETVKTYVLFSNFSWKSRCLCEVMWTNIVEPDRPQMTVHTAQKRCDLHARQLRQAYIHTFIIFNTHCFIIDWFCLIL